MTRLQKLLMPALASTVAQQGFDEVVGPVVRHEDVAGLTPGELVAMYGLDGPSPFGPQPEYVDVLRFESTPVMELSTPAADDARERPWPTYPTGFLRSAMPVPVWLLARTRLPIGAQYWRVRASGEEQQLSTYAGPAYGWTGAPGYAPPRLVGTRARWQGLDLAGAYTDDQRAVDLVHVGEGAPPEGFEPAPHAFVYHRTVAVADCEVFDLVLTATWRGAPVQVLGRSGEQARLELRDPDWPTVQALGAQPLEPGVFEVTADVAELDDVGGVTREASR